MQPHSVFAGVLLALLLPAASATSATLNGFEIDGALVPPDQIFPGGPARDGIPALTEPHMVPANSARFMRPDDPVLGMSQAGIAMAYPIKIMVWHEIVNDVIGDVPVAITYCPLCRSGVAFSRLVDGKTLEFGVSGLLYNSDMLMYDRHSESLWSQIPGQAISGKFRGRYLARLPLTHSTWAAWQKDHPETTVLSTDTGYRRDYEKDPYRGYAESSSTFFPIRHRSNRFQPKDLVVGLFEGDSAKAWPLHALARQEGPIRDSFNGREVTIWYDGESGGSRVVDADGRALPAATVYWFAWFAFFPFTQLYEAPPDKPGK